MGILTLAVKLRKMFHGSCMAAVKAGRNFHGAVSEKTAGLKIRLPGPRFGSTGTSVQVAGGCSGVIGLSGRGAP